MDVVKVVEFVFFFFKQKTAYEMRISDWSSDVCSSDLADGDVVAGQDVVDFQHQLLEGLVKKPLRQPDEQDNRIIVQRVESSLVFRHEGADRMHDDVVAFAVTLERLGIDELQDRGETATENLYAPHTNKIGRASCRERMCKSV